MKKYHLLLLLFFPLLLIAQPERKQKVNLQYGFRVNSSIMITSRDISEDDRLDKFLDTEFGFYCRAGKKFYGELGISFQYQRNTFSSVTPFTDPKRKTEFFETQYLPISARLVFYQPINKQMAFMANVGMAFHPLLKVTENYLYYTKDDVNHQLSINAGVSYKVKFLVFEASYRQMVLPYFKNKPTSKKPGYITVTLGVQLPY